MSWKKETLAIHAGQAPDPASRSSAVPIYQTTSFVFRSTEEAKQLFELQPQVWAPRLDLDGQGFGQGDPASADAGNIYTRITNPTTDVLERRLAALEGGVGSLALSSGAAAVSLAIMNLCGAGDHLVAARSLYGGTYNLFLHTLPRYGIETSFADAHKTESFSEQITDRTKCLFVETIGNPRLDTPDLAGLAELAHAHAIPLVVDNTVATPHLCRPCTYGADIVVHSLTKFLGGHGTSIGGAIVDSGQFDWAASGKFPSLSEPDSASHGLVWSEALGPGAYIMRARNSLLRDLGACISPFNSFLIVQGMQTLSLRMQKHCENAMAVAEFLTDHPRVGWVLYPGLSDHPTHGRAEQYLDHGFGALVGFGISGGKESGRRFIEQLNLFSHLANIGDVRSLAIHPASTTHSQLSPPDLEKSGISEDFIRLSIGLEHIDDILADLDQALGRSEP
jgi:O-acetylhomoserine (thiol)-lyase